jgi:hypothetical protein
MKNVWRVSRKWISGVAFMGLFAIGLTSCLNDDDNTPDIPVALVSLYHGSPNAPDLDIEVDNRQINTYPFEYTNYTGYLRFFTGQRNLKFGPYAASNIVIDTAVTFEANKAYSVFVVDTYENAGIVLLDDNSDTPSSGKAKVRVIHLSPDAPEIDFAVQGETAAVAEDLSFKEATVFTEIAAQEYDFHVRSSTSADQVFLTIPDITLQPGYYYTIIVRGFVTPPGSNTNVLSAQIVVN